MHITSFHSPQMILKKQQKAEVKYQLHKIIKISPAFNNTFVILGVVSPAREEIILHVDKDGKQLYKFISSQPINVAGMPNDHTVVCCDNPQSKIHVLDLKSRSVRSFSHEFIGDTTAALTIYYFPNTHLLGIVERGNAFDHRLSITYYSSKCDQIIDQSIIKDGEFNYNDVISKGNCDSMIMWCRCKHNQTIVIYIYEVRDPQDNANSLRLVEMRNTAITKERISSIFTASNMWELNKNEIMLVSQISQGSKHDSGPCRLYILDIDKSIIKEAAMPFNDNQRQIMIESFGWGEFSVFPITKYKIGADYMQTTLYFTNNKLEVIQILILRNYSSFNPTLPEYDKNSICIFEYQNYQPQHFRAITYKIATIKELYHQLILHLNQDFDDDLLLDSMRILCQL